MGDGFDGLPFKFAVEVMRNNRTPSALVELPTFVFVKNLDENVPHKCQRKGVKIHGQNNVQRSENVSV